MTPEEALNEKYNLYALIKEATEKIHNTPSPETLSRLDSIDKKMTDNYSKRELDEHFKDIQNSFSEIKE